jgi:hypothetical protein
MIVFHPIHEKYANRFSPPRTRAVSHNPGDEPYRLKMMWRRVISTRNRRDPPSQRGDEQYPPRTCAVFPGDEWFPPRTRALSPRSPKTWRACHEELLPRRFTHQPGRYGRTCRNELTRAMSQLMLCAQSRYVGLDGHPIRMDVLTTRNNSEKVVARERGRSSHRRNRSPLPTCHRQR